MLGGPHAVGVSGHAEDVHAPGLYFHDEQHVEALEKDRVDVEEIARQQAAGLRPEECPPGGVQIARNRAVAARPQDPPHRRRADVVAEAGQFAVHPTISPGRVIPREPQDQVPDFRAGAGASWPAWIGPGARDKAAVPGQQRARRDEPVAPQRRQQPGQRGQHCAVGPVRFRPGDLTPQHCHLVPQDQDLRVLGPLAAAQQHEPAEHPRACV